MNLLARARQYLASVIGGYSLTEAGSIWGHGPTKSGQVITQETAMNISAVFAAVRLLSETKACLPCGIFRQIGKGYREPATSHPAYKLVHIEPNREMTAKRFWEQMEVYNLLWGNAYAEIQWDMGGNPRGLWVLEPWRVKAKRDDNGALLFEVTEKNGTQKLLADADILRKSNFSWDGIEGKSTVSFGRESMGLTAAAESYGSSFFGSGGIPSGVLEHPGKLPEAARKEIRKDWNAIHSPSHGGRNNEVAILWENMKYNKIGIPPDDAQFLSTREFQITEIARWFNVPPHMLRDLTRATFSNIEHQQIEFVVYSLIPGMVEWEQEISRKLLGPGMYAKFNVRGLMRGDMAAQAAFFRQMFAIGVYSLNEIRELMDENPIGPDGDQRFVPMNMIPLDQAKEFASSKSKPLPSANTNPPTESNGDPQAVENDPKAGLSLMLGEAAGEMLSESLARMIRKEATAARRAAANHNKFLSWMDGFYPEHHQTLTESLLRPVRCWLILNGGNEQGAALLCQKAASIHVEKSRQELLTAAECTPAEFTTKIEECVSRWERERLTINLKEFLPCQAA